MSKANFTMFNLPIILCQVPICSLSLFAMFTQYIDTEQLSYINRNLSLLCFHASSVDLRLGLIYSGIVEHCKSSRVFLKYSSSFIISSEPFWEHNFNVIYIDYFYKVTLTCMWHFRYPKITFLIWIIWYDLVIYKMYTNGDTLECLPLLFHQLYLKHHLMVLYEKRDWGTKIPRYNDVFNVMGFCYVLMSSVEMLNGEKHFLASAMRTK